ncbi:monooxygenase FAD-binding protein [Polyporus arcularius HHB13444]|uniref:Monooxygenase FAD-binding protein n=1 Tax=Polyporus arcularius HHB13444 TaxID=1314778 RepID=A0A5C3NTT5_9APHY|nr:monooxygenase FAD-binding protein [Polyporus arcularius HHB13444]
MTSTSTQPRIAIIGGGPGGLVLLLTLLRRGVPATVYERDTGFNARAHLGGMLDLGWGSGQRALRENGLEDVFKAHSRRNAEEAKVCGKDGVPILHRKEEDVPDEKDSRPEIDRSVLRKIMLDAVPPENIKWGHALTSIRALDGAVGQHELTFTNGFVTVADLVVGADGANSRVRPLLSPATPIYHEVTGAEISISPEVAASPDMADVSAAVGSGSCFMGQDNKVLGLQRNGDGRIRAYAWHRNADPYFPADPVEVRKALLDIYSDWAPWVRKFIAQCDDAAVYPRALYYLPVGHRWEHKAGVTLVGDAAHLMSPFAGAGANLAMLDGLELGLVLAEVISKGAEVEERETAVAAWEKKMLDKAEEFATYSFKHLNAFVNPGAPATAIEVMKAFMESEIRREA